MVGLGCHFVFVGRHLPSSKGQGQACCPSHHLPAGSEWHCGAGECGDYVCIRPGNAPKLGRERWDTSLGGGLTPTLAVCNQGLIRQRLRCQSGQAYFVHIPVESLFVNICSRKCHFIKTQLPLILISCSKTDMRIVRFSTSRNNVPIFLMRRKEIALSGCSS